jgi:hypothetical protein
MTTPLPAIPGPCSAEQTSLGLNPQSLPTGRQVQSEIPPIVIRPSRGWISLRLHDLWEYRELLYFLAWRDIKVRYKQTVLGAAWAIIQPLTTMVIFTIIFGQLAKIPSDVSPIQSSAFVHFCPGTTLRERLVVPLEAW